jgi:hypothetical protein
MNALGMGFAPSMSVFMISILGLTAGYSMMVGAIGTLTQVAAATVAGAQLGRGSSEKMLRQSFWIRALAMALPLFAWPGTVTAGQHDRHIDARGNRLLERLTGGQRAYVRLRGPAVVRQHALSRTHIGRDDRRSHRSAVVWLGMSVGYPAFACSTRTSSVIRVVAGGRPRPKGALSDLDPAAAPQPRSADMKRRRRPKPPPSSGLVIEATRLARGPRTSRCAFQPSGTVSELLPIQPRA